MRPCGGAASSRERKTWWRTILIASVATVAACLINPYGLTGALYPLELAGTMSNPIFSRNVAELMPIPEFIRNSGLWNLPLQLHLVTMILGGLSFLLPLFWSVGVRLAQASTRSRNVGAEESAPAAKTAPAAARSGRGRSGAGHAGGPCVFPG